MLCYIYKHSLNSCNKHTIDLVSCHVNFFEECCRQRGAILVDNLEIENVDIILNPYESGESTALLAEFKLNINEYLKELTHSPVRSLAGIIAFNLNNSDLVNTPQSGE